MDQPAKIMTSEGADARKWIGRIIMAVILGEAIWSLIVSVMNNLVVPWLGDIMGPSSGVPTSFTQRPYNYPDLFISILELGIAGLVAAVLNYFVQRPTAGRVKPVKRVVPAFDVDSARVIPPAAPPVVPRQGTMTHAALSLAPEPVAPAPPLAKLEPVTPPAPVRVAPEPPVPRGDAGTDRKTSGCGAASAEPGGGKASATPTEGRARQAEEAQRGVLQHCRRSHAFRRRVGCPLYFPMQNLLKIRFRMSSLVVAPVISSS